MKSYAEHPYPFVLRACHATPWLQGWGGLIVNWKNDPRSGDTRELRPYVGVKVFVPNSTHLHVFDWTRFEFRRTTNTDKGTVTRVWRFRTRPGVEFPLSAQAWQPGTFYGLANGELFVEHHFVDAVRFMSGAGYIKNDRVRMEFNYVLEPSPKLFERRARVQQQQLSSRLQVQLQGRTTSQTGWTAITSRMLRDTGRARQEP